jgi:ABC-type proline/glycine betaine transport system ATPase subunit
MHVRHQYVPEDYLDRYPSELSGGQQQRIGVVRALAAEQDIIQLWYQDNIFSNGHMRHQSNLLNNIANTST